MRHIYIIDDGSLEQVQLAVLVPHVFALENKCAHIVINIIRVSINNDNLILTPRM